MQKELLFCLIILFYAVNSTESQRKTIYKYYPVLRVIDGDTFRADDGSQKESIIRLIGVDAPESRNTGRKVKSEFGAEATKYLHKLIGGKKVSKEEGSGDVEGVRFIISII